MFATRAVKGRGSITTNHGQVKILKHSTPDLLTYIQKAVQTGVYRSSEEIEEMNQRLKDSPTDLRRVRWNVSRGSKIQDYPKEYEILSLNPPTPFKPKMPIKYQKKMYNKYVRDNRPTDRLARAYLSKQSNRTESEPATADEYYRRLLGSNKALKMDTAMGSKSATLSKAYAVAVKQYHVMRTENLSEQDALDKVEELLAKEDWQEKATSRRRAEDLRTKNVSNVANAAERGVAAFPGAGQVANHLRKREKSTSAGDKRKNINESGNDDALLSMLYSENQRSFEGMVKWTKRLQAVPYKQWSVGGSVTLDHWIARRVLGISEETWLELLEGDSPELLGRGRDIVMARHALFPETALDMESQPGESNDIDSLDDKEDELDALLATLAKWNSNKDEVQDTHNGSNASYSDHEERIADELQEWRKRHAEVLPFSQWLPEDKAAFDVWARKFVTALIPENLLPKVDLEETKKNLLNAPPQLEEAANEFWSDLRDETAAEMLLQTLLQRKDTNVDHPFWSMDYDTQIRRLVNLGSVREIANEYATEADRAKFLSRYGDYLMEGVQFDHLVRDPNGPIVGSDLGELLQGKYDIKPNDRFVLRKLDHKEDEAAKEARSLYRAWNKLKAGRANYEEKLFQKGLLGISYEAVLKPKNPSS